MPEAEKIKVDYSAQKKPPYGWEVFALEANGKKTIIRKGQGNWTDPFFMAQNITILWGLKENKK